MTCCSLHPWITCGSGAHLTGAVLISIWKILGVAGWLADLLQIYSLTDPNPTRKHELSPIVLSRVLYVKLFASVFDLRIENKVVIKHNNKEFVYDQYSKEINP
jgi:hypothetical protein